MRGGELGEMRCDAVRWDGMGELGWKRQRKREKEREKVRVTNRAITWWSLAPNHTYLALRRLGRF